MIVVGACTGSYPDLSDGDSLDLAVAGRDI